MKRPLILLALYAAAGAAPSTASAADLLAVYQRALQNDPQLREAEATRLATLESKPQALANLLPQLSAGGIVSREHDNGSSNIVQPVTIAPVPPATGPGTTVLEAFPFAGQTQTTARRYGFDLKQNLFRWENWVALQKADSQVAQAEADYQAARQDLIQRVAQRYFDVLAAQDDLEAQQTALKSIQRQLEQAEARYQSGLIAVTDVEEARAAHDNGVATVIAAKRTLASTIDLLREISGDTFDFLARPIEPFETASPDPVSEERWVDMALQQNLSLVSSRLAADIARENVSTARGGHYPTLDLVGSSYHVRNDGTDTYTTGEPAGGTTLNQSQNTIGLQLTFPIYSGGSVSSQVRQAVYQHRAAKERLERVARQTEHDARDSYLGVLSEISRVKALRRAVESNAVSLRATESGYEAGTRTAVDVLQSRQLWVQATTDYSRSRYDYMLNVLKLQQVAGTLSQQSLEKLNGLLTDVPPPAPPAPPDQPAVQ